LSVLREEKTISEQAMHSEIEVLRGKFIEVTTELAKQKSRCSDLQVSLKQSKDTIAELVQKENNLIDELQGKMSQLGQSQDQWKNKVHEQKETIA
jgi:septation ring formation regulator EzrA